MLIVKKLIAIALVMAIFICLGLDVYLNYHYVYTRPERPQPDIGRIYLLNVHGSIVYLTKQEDSLLNWAFQGMVISIAIAALFKFYCDPFKKTIDNH
jgi:hypothetical protein